LSIGNTLAGIAPAGVPQYSMPGHAGAQRAVMNLPGQPTHINLTGTPTPVQPPGTQAAFGQARRI